MAQQFLGLRIRRSDIATALFIVRSSRPRLRIRDPDLSSAPVVVQEGLPSQLRLSAGIDKVNAVPKGEVYSTYEVNCGFLVPLLAPRAAEEVLFGKEGVTLSTAAAVRIPSHPISACLPEFLMPCAVGYA